MSEAVGAAIAGALVSGALAVVAAAIGGTLAFFAGKRRAEHEIRYANLYQRQADVIADLHRLLYDLQRSVANLTAMVEFAGDPSKQQKLKEAGALLNKLQDYYQRNSVWLDDDTSKKLQAFLDQIYGICDEFSVIGRAIGLQGFEGAGNLEEQKVWRETYAQEFDEQHPREGWRKLDSRVKSEVPKLRQGLRAQFREILGTANLT